MRARFALHPNIADSWASSLPFGGQAGVCPVMSRRNFDEIQFDFSSVGAALPVFGSGLFAE
jgi:hypothetical protein